MTQKITISPRTLGILNMPDFCPRCFWIRLRSEDKFPFQIPMPGIFSSIDSYSKKLVHAFFDEHGALPPWVPPFGDVKTYVQPLHYSWFNCEHGETGITLRGTPDEVFQLADDSYHVVDYKTAKVTGRQDELYPLYDAQLNAYAYVAERLVRRSPLRPVSGLSHLYGAADGCPGRWPPDLDVR
jgi:hypothetical protein